MHRIFLFFDVKGLVKDCQRACEHCPLDQSDRMIAQLCEENAVQCPPDQLGRIMMPLGG